MSYSWIRDSINSIAKEVVVTFTSPVVIILERRGYLQTEMSQWPKPVKTMLKSDWVAEYIGRLDALIHRIKQEKQKDQSTQTTSDEMTGSGLSCVDCGDVWPHHQETSCNDDEGYDSLTPLPDIKRVCMDHEHMTDLKEKKKKKKSIFQMFKNQQRKQKTKSMPNLNYL